MTLHALYGTLAPEPSPPEGVQTYHITNETGAGRVTIETLFQAWSCASTICTSLYAYLREYRLQTAQKLLAETDASIAEIAHRVGYENPNKFSSAFRQVFGMTPTEYRKRCPIG